MTYQRIRFNFRNCPRSRSFLFFANSDDGYNKFLSTGIIHDFSATLPPPLPFLFISSTMRTSCAEVLCLENRKAFSVRGQVLLCGAAAICKKKGGGPSFQVVSCITSISGLVCASANSFKVQYYQQKKILFALTSHSVKGIFSLFFCYSNSPTLACRLQSLRRIFHSPSIQSETLWNKVLWGK